MINKYFNLTQKVEDLENEIESKIHSLVEEEGQAISIYFYTGSFQITGEYFSTHFRNDGTKSTSTLCKSSDMPKTVELAVEKVEKMFKAKEGWEELLVKIDEALADEALADE